MKLTDEQRVELWALLRQIADDPPDDGREMDGAIDAVEGVVMDGAAFAEHAPALIVAMDANTECFAADADMEAATHALREALKAI